MIDIINILNIFNLVLNTISTSFTLLFILYRFTSLFSYMLGFIRFCAKIVKGMFYIKNNIYYYSSGYSYTTLTNDVNNSKSIFSKMGNYINRTYRFFFPKKKDYTILPVYEIRESYINDIENENNNTNVSISIKKTHSDVNDIEKNLINAQLNDLMNYDYDEYNSNDESSPFINNFNDKTSFSSIFNSTKLAESYSYNKSSLSSNSSNMNTNNTSHNRYNIDDSDLLDDNKNSIMLQDIYYDCNDKLTMDKLTTDKLTTDKLTTDKVRDKKNMLPVDLNLGNSNLFLNFDFIKKNIENKQDDDEIIDKFQSLSL